MRVTMGTHRCKAEDFNGSDSQAIVCCMKRRPAGRLLAIPFENWTLTGATLVSSPSQISDLLILRPPLPKWRKVEEQRRHDCLGSLAAQDSQ